VILSGYVTKYFTPYGQVLQVGTLHSDVLYPVPKLCFIRESHLCRSLYFEKRPSRVFFIQYEFFCIYIYIFRKTTFRQNTSFPFYNLYFSAIPNVSSTLLVLYAVFPQANYN